MKKKERLQKFLFILFFSRVGFGFLEEELYTPPPFLRQAYLARKERHAIDGMQVMGFMNYGATAGDACVLRWVLGNGIVVE